MEKPFKNTGKNDETVENMSVGTPLPKKKNAKKKKGQINSPPHNKKMKTVHSGIKPADLEDLAWHVTEDKI